MYWGLGRVTRGVCDLHRNVPQEDVLAGGGSGCLDNGTVKSGN